MTAPRNLAGDRFGRLVVIEEAGRNKYSKTLWRCRCDCGTEVISVGNNLVSGNTTSCGCFRRDFLKSRATIPGGHHSRLYRIWSHMKDRCNSKNNKDYYRYGERGVSVCPEWAKFNDFYSWAMANGYAENLTIERRNRDGNYCPENCTWIPHAEQAANRSNNHVVELGGETHTLAEWSRKTGINQGTLWNRINSGWSAEKALTTPIRRKKQT